jgi:hypothetical protein
LLEGAGFVDLQIGRPVDTLLALGGETNARAFDVKEYPFLARKPLDGQG